MDDRWLEACREGDTAALEQFVETHRERIFRLAYSILDDAGEAEDATQEVFLAALRALDSYRGEASFATWLSSIAIHLCRNRLKSRKRRERLQQLLQGHFRAHSTSIEDSVDRREADEEVWQAIRRLDERHRLPLILRYYHDLPVTEIAEMLHIPIGTVHSRLNAARQTLQRALKDRQG